MNYQLRKKDNDMKLNQWEQAIREKQLIQNCSRFIFNEQLTDSLTTIIFQLQIYF